MSERRLHMDCSLEHCLLGDPSPCVLFTKVEPPDILMPRELSTRGGTAQAVDPYNVTPAQDGNFLTPAEHRLMDLLSEVVKGFGQVYDADIQRGDSRASTHNNDMGEVVNHIHDLQARVLSRAAARAYPGRYRLL